MRKMNNYKCLKCGTEFEPSKFQQIAKKKGKNVYCSKKCQTESDNKKLEERRKAQLNHYRWYGETRGIKNIIVSYRYLEQ